MFYIVLYIDSYYIILYVYYHVYFLVFIYDIYSVIFLHMYYLQKYCYRLHYIYRDSSCYFPHLFSSYIPFFFSWHPICSPSNIVQFRDIVKEISRFLRGFANIIVIVYNINNVYVFDIDIVIFCRVLY